MTDQENLDETGRVVVLARGVRLRTPGLRGTASLLPSTGPGQRAPEVDTLSPALVEALARNDLTPFRTVRIVARPAAGAPRTQLRSSDGRRGIAVEVPAPRADQQTVCFPVPIDRGLQHPAGGDTWHCSMFSRPATREVLRRWCTGASG